MQYSFINEDPGYVVRLLNRPIRDKIPYVENTDPRLVRYMRTVYFFNQINARPCTPLKDQFWVESDDNYQLNRYVRQVI
jgi:hypothetical protein